MIAFKHTDKGDTKRYSAQLIELGKFYNRFHDFGEHLLCSKSVKRYGHMVKTPTHLSCQVLIEGDYIRVDTLKLVGEEEVFSTTNIVIFVKSEVDEETLVLYTPEEFKKVFRIRPEQLLTQFRQHREGKDEALDLYFNGEFLITLMGNRALPPNLKEIKKYAEHIVDKLNNEFDMINISVGMKPDRLSETLYKNFVIYRAADKDGVAFHETSLICPYLDWGTYRNHKVFKLLLPDEVEMPFSNGAPYVFEGDREHFAQLINTYLMLVGMAM